MKLLASTILLGTAAAFIAPQQHVLKQAVTQRANRVSSELHEALREKLTMFNELSEKANLHAWESFRKPANTKSKPHVRRPDHEWDFITRGDDVQQSSILNAHGEHEPELDGKLNTYNLRTRHVDLKKLGVDPGVKQYSGYLDDEEDDKHLFYWFFESRSDPKNDPIVLWLNGGPGCSSLTGLFLELGPSSVDRHIKLKYNPYSWNSNASIIFLDQPVNVGFSYSGSSVSTTAAAGRDVYALLTLFFKQFPEYTTQDFHIAGESYGGHYLPVFTAEILSHRKRNINLKSILIGNGLTDELTQYEYYRPMACGEGGWPAVLDKSECQAMDNALPRCLTLIDSCYNTESVWSCVPASIYCNNVLLGPYQRTGQNVYDVRGQCEDTSNLCYTELGWISSYLNKRYVQEALGVEVESYDSCNFDINRNFLLHGDWMLPIHRLVPDILAQIPILVYAGDADFICNWLGNLAWTEALEWPGQAAYDATMLTNLTLSPNPYAPHMKHNNNNKGHDDHHGDHPNKGEEGGETVIGSIKSSGNFTFIKLHAGGHMIPFDQPKPSLDMFNRWIAGEWWTG